MATKIGMKKNLEDNRQYLRTMSKKRQSDLTRYFNLKQRLFELSRNKSELSGHRPDWQSSFVVEPHHIKGRTGHKLYDPFNIILLTANEHRFYQEHMSDANKQYLLELVRPIRIKQGFVR